MLLCRDCGASIRCASCDAALISAASSSLLCRYCGASYPLPSICPSCGGHRLKFFGAGALRIYEEIRTLLPTLRVSRLDSDVSANNARHEQVLQDFVHGRTQVLVGTQTILRPSLLRPVSVSAIASIEPSLTLPEYDGEERAWRMARVMQSLATGDFIWQTYQPEHRVISAVLAGSDVGFLEKEEKLRREFHWPPFVHLAKITMRLKSAHDAEEQARIVFDRLTRVPQKYIKLYEPLPSYVRKTKGFYSWSILIKFDPRLSLKRRDEFLSYVPSKWEIEIDPLDTLN